VLRIKICGMTRREDVLEAVRLGVDAIGVVLYEDSPRHVTADQAQKLVADLPAGVERVGVFVRAGAAEIAQAVSQAGFSAVQLYEGPTRHELEQAGCTVPIIRAVQADALLASQLALHAGEAILVDAPAQKRPGGTGTEWDLSLLDRVIRPRYLVLAGGLHAGNVQAAVTRAKPDAVDVSTGVEKSPGIKDPARMAAFVAACAPFRKTSQEAP
jgi:phosphoribosylanthranilate isomerase